MRTLPAYIVTLASILLFPALSNAQFYNGAYQEFGKNRVQHQQFIWNYLQFQRYNVYYYTGGRNVAVYTAQASQSIIKELEESFDYALEDKINFIVFNKLDHLHQSNIGYRQNDPNNIGGVTRIMGAKVFVYFEGDHAKLEQQIRAGVAEIMINQMMFGTSWKEMIKNSTLLNLPDWYVNGLKSYVSEPWNVDIDDRVRDGVLSGRFRKFNRLMGDDARYAGHALWHYIAVTYGENVIPNILYMARISRNIESGFLFVLGVSLNTLTDESMRYYAKKYELDDEVRDKPKGENVDVKVKKHLIYTQLKISPDGKFVAFATNEMGQRKAYVHEVATGKTRRLVKIGHKLDRINDTSYPLMAWHPSSKILAIITERKGQIWLHSYIPETGEMGEKNMYNIEKVLDMSYAPDGKKMLLSAVKDGRSDIFLYSVAANSHTPITNDHYDDLYPRFVNGGKQILFSSNRPDDTLRAAAKIPELQLPTKDLFLYDFSTRSTVLKRITETPGYDETHSVVLPDGKFSFLSDQSGIRNRYIAHFDSTISHIDTVVHYRYFAKAEPVTNYSRNIIEQDVATDVGKIAQILFMDGRYQLVVSDIAGQTVSVDMDLMQTGFRDTDEPKEGEGQPDEATEGKAPKATGPGNVTYVKVKVFQQEPADTLSSDEVDFNNYTFEGEGARTTESAGETTTGKDPPEDRRFVTITTPDGPLEAQPFTLPKTRDYNLNFTATNIVSQFDFDYANLTYQRYIGEPYFNQGLATVFKVDMMDLFEDYNIQGGIRYSLNNNNTEYFLAFEDRLKRLDKTYIFQRQTLTRVSGLSLVKTFVHQGRYIIRYPFSEVAALRFSANIRNDQFVALSTDRPNLESPNINNTWLSGKIEYIFDNSISRGLNLYNGTRAKVFFEFYNEIDPTQYTVFLPQTQIFIAGIDYRKYIKVHRDIVWANRFAGSTSFGPRKLLYYMGSIDNWVVFSDRPKFDDSNPVATEENYFFQSVATPMRGFLQNARNGNSFALLNSELRVPIFRYLMNKPIKSEFVHHFQVIAFGDVGTAWTGRSPLSDDNAFNSRRIVDGPLTITLKNQKEPLIGGYGLGVRSKLWGYFARLDWAYGVEDREILRPKLYFSLGLDF